MSNNLIIGLGGTGAKIVESFIHLCAAGLGPNEASVAFLDQDQANGNTARAVSTLRHYIDTRAVLRSSDLSRSLSEETGFVRTMLSPLQSQSHSDDIQTGKEALREAFWVPHGQDRTLGKIIDYPNLRGANKLLANVFFDDSADELGMPLDAGYQGRPHVGAAALLAEMQAEASGWKDALDELIDRGNNGPVRIFLCGSAFGGTGAAALPTLAREIRRRASGVRDVAVSAALMLPYFDFAEPDKTQDTNVAQSPYLRQQTRAALDYYKRLLDSEELFKNIYLVGWDPLFSLGYHEKGQQDQRSPALVPELYGAMAAADALTGNVADAGDNKVLAIGRAGNNAVDWDDMPATIRDNNVRGGYARLLRLAAMWQFSCRDGISYERGLNLHFRKEAWYKQHFSAAFSRNEKAHEHLKPIDQYVETLLRYVALMAARSHTGGIEDYFKLWRSYPIADIDLYGDPRKTFPLKKQFKKRDRDDLEGFIGAAQDQSSALKSADIIERLAHYKRKNLEKGQATQGLVPFMDALWDVCGMQMQQGASS